MAKTAALYTMAFTTREAPQQWQVGRIFQSLTVARKAAQKIVKTWGEEVKLYQGPVGGLPLVTYQRTEWERMPA